MGDEQYQYDWSHARLHDEFGSLHHLEIIDSQYETIKDTFSQTIREINKIFTDDYPKWQTVNLKEWIDSYESSRFTQIDGYTAIITSEYNMDCVKEWLIKEYTGEKNRQTDIKQDTTMKTKSINNNGCSVCEQGKENYTTFIAAGAFRGTKYYQYDYRHSEDGELFSTVAKSLEEYRKRRDEWLLRKKP